jgi:hypothetical protein
MFLWIEETREIMGSKFCPKIRGKSDKAAIDVTGKYVPGAVSSESIVLNSTPLHVLHIAVTDITGI